MTCHMMSCHVTSLSLHDVSCLQGDAQWSLRCEKDATLTAIDNTYRFQNVKPGLINLFLKLGFITLLGYRVPPQLSKHWFNVG